MDKIVSKGKTFVDSHGRERIFNGINIVDKEPFKFGKTSQCYANELNIIDEFYERGFNMVRLGITWSAVEPEPGEYNEELIDSLVKILDRCEQKGIYAFIDMHQDLYSAGIDGVGDGAPRWAIMTDGRPAIPHKFVWAEPYFWGPACHRAFDNFWNNTPYRGKGLLDYYADMWKHLASRLKDHPALFGFDLLNEPFPGTDGGRIFRKLVASVVKVTLTDKRIDRKKLISDALSKDTRMKVFDQYNGEILQTIGNSSKKLLAKFDTLKYTPFINKVAAAIRTATDNGVIFVDNCYYSNLGIPCSNVPVMVGGRRETNQCFTPHGYDFMVDTPLYKYASNYRIKTIFDEHKRTQERMNVPVIVGEWGGFSEGVDWFPHVRFVLNMFDSNKWSNTYWAYFNGLLDAPVMSVLTRPYPRAVTGAIDSYSYDCENDVFILSYTQDRAYDVPTEIFAHKPIDRVETDGKWSSSPVGDTSSVVSVTTDTGTHTVKIYFKEPLI